MGDSSAVRNKRWYHHKIGDHSLCNLDRCPEARTLKAQGKPLDQSVRGITDPDKVLKGLIKAESPAEYGFGPDGAKYWCAMNDRFAITEDIHPILVEACRVIDRLRKLDEILKGRSAWFHLRMKLPDQEKDHTYTIVVNGAMREARENAITLRALVAELRAKLEGKPDESDKDKPKKPNVIAEIQDEIKARRESKLA